MKNIINTRGVFFSALVIFSNISILSQQPISFPQNTGYRLLLDQDRILYVSSTDGLNSYDGNKTKTYHGPENNFLGGNIQSPIFEDDSGQIWFATYIALNTLNTATGKFQYFNFLNCLGDTIKKNYNILEYQKDYLIVRADTTIQKFNLKTQKVDECHEINASEFDNFNSQCIYGNRDITFFGRKMGDIFIEKYSKFGELLSSDTIKSESSFFSIQKFYNDRLLYSMGKGLYTFNLKDNSSSEIYQFEKLIVDFYVYDEKTVLILMNDKIIKYSFQSSSSFEEYPIPAEGNKIAVYTKDLKTIFYSIDGKGISFFNTAKNKFKHIQYDEEKIVINARSPVEFNNGSIFIPTISNGIKEFNQDFELTNHHILNNELLGVRDMSASKDILIANGYFNIFKYNKPKSTFEKINLINDQHSNFSGIYSLYVDHNDEFNILTDETNGLFRITQKDDLTFELKKLFTTSKQKEYLSAFKLKHDQTLFGIGGTTIELYDFCEGKYNLLKEIDIQSDIKSVWEVPKSNEVYISSSTGLFHFPNGLEESFNRVSDKKNLLHQTIYYILGNKEFLYISSNQGLLRYNTIDSTVHQFTLADGIQGLEYNTTSGLSDSKGRLIFGGTNGINAFYPDSIKFIDYNTPIHLSNILINDEDYNWEININLKDSIKFDYKKNTLTFQFHGIDYSDPDAVELRCKMESYDDEWIRFDKNEGSMRYPNLPPGHYTFLMQATNSDKIWSNEIREIDVIITPPVWQTWWFRVTALTLIGLFTWLSFKSYYKRKLVQKDLELREQRLEFEKQKILQAERNRIAAEMHDDLGGGLTSISYLAHRILKKNSDADLSELIKKILTQSGELINNMSEIIWAMNSGFDTLPSLIAYCRNYTKKQCQIFEWNYSESIPIELPSLEFTGQKRRNIFLVIKESLNNCAKHANAQSIVFTVNITSDMLQISISDDGCGFVKKPNLTGNGLKNMQKRIEDINGAFNVKSNPGTKISITMPI